MALDVINAGLSGNIPGPGGADLHEDGLDIPPAIYYAPKNAKVSAAVQNVLNDVQNGITKPADAWAAAVKAAEAADAGAADAGA
jgi:hypothetical protein